MPAARMAIVGIEDDAKATLTTPNHRGGSMPDPAWEASRFVAAARDRMSTSRHAFQQPD